MARGVVEDFLKSMESTTVTLIGRQYATTFLSLVVFAWLVNIPAMSAAFQCEACNRTACVVPDHCPGGLVVDPCGCCKDCAKVLEQECGGQFGLKGRCDKGLYCAINPEHGERITGEEDGTCREIPRPTVPSCEDVACDLVLEPTCQDDSLSEGGQVPPGQCCPAPYRCLCMPCTETPPTCPDPAQIPVLQTLGTGEPGQCCDVYECLDKYDICADVTCENDPFANVTCPMDSTPLSPLVTQKGCCLQHAGCVCRPPDQCQIPVCLPGTRPQLVEPRTGMPGRCCDHIQCVSDSSVVCLGGDGAFREDGEAWNLDTCTMCYCDQGLTRCDKAECADLDHCSWISIPEGECCHKCMGCTTGNMTYPNGAEWQQDSCATCYCEEGQVYCRAELCRADCVNPRYVPGICCPLCDEHSTFELPTNCPSLVNCTLAPFCPHGLEEDERGCYQCTCKDNIVVGIIPDLCDLECPYGYSMDVNGLAMCECSTAAPSPATSPTTVPVSTTITVVEVTSQPLPTELSHPHSGQTAPPDLRCPSMSSCQKDCAFGFRVSKDGCPKCKCNRCPPFLCHKKCVHGYAYNENGCVLCKCIDNTTQQTVPSVPPSVVPDEGGQTTCLTDDGRMYDDGESWHSDCRHCFCLHGRELCTLITCPVPRCRHPVVLPGDCCASCPDEERREPSGTMTSCHANGSQHIAEGETWHLNKCTLCICHNGEMLCEAERCPPLTCSRPVYVPDRCCPMCLDASSQLPYLPDKTPGELCQVSPGMVFQSGDIWRVSACQSCLCRDGQVNCYSQTCPLLTKCNKTVMRKGQCCPQCIEESAPKLCVLGMEVYTSGETWLLNNCTWCLCHDGRVLCLETQCGPDVDCASANHLTESCCPVCFNQSRVGIHDGSGNKQSTPRSRVPVDPDMTNYIGLLIVIIALVVLVIILFLVVGLLCYRKKKRKERERCQRAKAMQALFQKEPSHVALSRRPKSVNLEYRGHYPLVGEVVRTDNRFDYQPPSHNKFHCYDETVGLLAPKSKMMEGEDLSIHKSCLICPSEDSLSKGQNGFHGGDKKRNDLNVLHKQSLEDNFNINCGSDNTLTKSQTDSGNDLSGETDKLSEFDNAACVSSSCSDFAVDKVGSPGFEPTEDTSVRLSGLSQVADPDLPLEQVDLLLDIGSGDIVWRSQPDTQQNIPAKPANGDKHMRYSVNDDVWLRNSSSHEKEPMADKFIRYSVGAEPCVSSGQTSDQLLGVPSPVCDTSSYRKSL